MTNPALFHLLDHSRPDKIKLRDAGAVVRSVDRNGGMPTVKPPTQEESAAAVPTPPPRSPELTKLTELRAYRIWVEVGRPTGKVGEALKERNWAEAEKQVNAEVEARAFQFWEQQGP